MTLHRIEHPRGPNAAPAIIKHAVRLGRRLRTRNIWPVDFPSIVEAGLPYLTLRAGKRVIVLDDTGACRACLRPYDDGNERVTDPQGWVAHYNRTHAMWLSFAAEDRRRGWTRVARGHVNLAKTDREILQEAP